MDRMGQFSHSEEKYMSEALTLARKGGIWTSPNPRVGAVIVKNGKVVGRGYHKKYGEDHAEVNALKNAWESGKSVEGATLFVTLEPCVHTNKKRPPCVPAVIESGVAKVVIAMRDPNPLVSGKGILTLKKAKIEVRVGLLQNDAEQINEKFIHWMKTGLPFVGMKVATSLDGKIATRTGESKWITSEKSRRLVHTLRDQYDAILVGSGTVIADNPVLSGEKKDPLRVILDSTLRVTEKYRVLRDRNVIIATTVKASPKSIQVLEKKGFRVKNFGKTISIPSLLRYLGSQNISSVFIEGGSRIFGSFSDARAIDFVHWFTSPIIIGGDKSKNSVGGNGIARLKNALEISSPIIQKIGRDLYTAGPIKK